MAVAGEVLLGLSKIPLEFYHTFTFISYFIDLIFVFLQMNMEMILITMEFLLKSSSGIAIHSDSISFIIYCFI